MVYMEKRFVYGILAIIVVIAAVYVLWNLPKGQTADKKGLQHWQILQIIFLQAMK